MNNRCSGLRALPLALAALCLLTAACASSRPSPTEPELVPVRLVAVSWRGEFFAQDPTDGFIVPVGHTGFARLNSLTITPDERILSVATPPDANPILIEIDPDTGRGTPICTLDAPVDVRGLAAAPSGALYAVLARTDDHFRNSFAEINPANGHVAILRDSNWIGMHSLEFCPHGELFTYINPFTAYSTGATRPAAVLRVDMTDWSLHRVSNVSEDSVIQSLAFDQCDRAYLSARPNAFTNVAPSIIAPTDVQEESGHVIVGDAAFRVPSSDIRGIAYLGAHTFWADHASELGEPVPIPDAPHSEQNP